MPFDSTIKCPECGTEVTLTEAIRSEIESTARKEIEAEVSQKFENKIQKEREKVAESSRLEIADLRTQLTEQSEKLKISQAQELELRKRERNLKEREDRIPIELQKQLLDAQNQLRIEAKKEANEETALEIRKRDTQISQYKEQVEELKRRMEQGSQELQGEVLELALEETLKLSFPEDDIQPVKKGQRGADVVQKVRSLANSDAAILWESKNAKNWQESWIPKLKEDQRESGACVSVLVSRVLPDGMSLLGLRDGVWVCHISCVIGMGSLLRAKVIEVERARSALIGMNVKSDMIYKYLTGPQFENQLIAIISAFKSLREEIDSEKAAMTKRWAKREQQISIVLNATSSMHGTLHAIIGDDMKELLPLSPTSDPSHQIGN